MLVLVALSPCLEWSECMIRFPSGHLAVVEGVVASADSEGRARPESFVVKFSAVQCY